MARSSRTTRSSTVARGVESVSLVDPGQKAENNLITGNFGGAGIRLNTVFGGHNFGGT